jgi:antibiotic biosynthesis monooxygenase (ABM) superfamily enzyme
VTTAENAPKYEKVVREQVIPEIEARDIPGFLHIDLARRPLGEGYEFLTIMWFDKLESITTFMGADYEAAHVPDEAKAVLLSYDERSSHFEVVDRRPQFVSGTPRRSP